MNATQEELNCAVINMHSLAEEGLNQIESLSRLTAKMISTKSMNSIEMQDIEKVMRVIRDIAQSALNAIDIEAENVGYTKAIQVKEMSA